ncbi:kinesin motor protein CIN8 NDAI_0D00870 [Naumovozyma dairenensis CBS 421]|uniref:Kinesin motor domain-containing protein n=1 Tax=Naumovozyma dairenensis (strain ATCC 10597 / BCRC 20456 / CBS 421 / NBRC 0211 / NRRL Y-12639) TaxID=1071378 RepID=G0W9E0_NAUDC|nr:hypothetical protein NDAI_0D00870 [Naumovozyma dairenensis CBS 421]CCD24401.1 hypothetical protein NDAI_0D00870 [Naumovozyma dairenensis CBS 421]
MVEVPSSNISLSSINSTLSATSRQNNSRRIPQEQQKQSRRDPKEGEQEEEELNITVAVRCRGRNEREIKLKSSVIVTVPDINGSNEVSINTTDDVGITAQMNSKTYTVDKVFGPSANQQLIFDEVAEPLFLDFIKGYNCTVLVYGMTSTGKTYTMTGDEKLYNGELSESAGIIPRILFKLFDTLEMNQEDYVVKCSFIELYNEDLKDLLNDNNNSINNSKSNINKLRIFDSSTASNVNVPGSNASSRANSRNNSPRLNPSTSNVGTTNNNYLRRKLKSSRYSNPENSNIFTSNASSSVKNMTKNSFLSNSKNQTSNLNTNSNTRTNPPKLPTSSLETPPQDDNNNGIYIQNLQEFHISNAKEGLALLQKGLKYRQVASTKMNDFSSRSHTIFTITLYKEHQGTLFRLSKMNLVDLAGSENINRSGAINQRAKETGSINQSLLTLGRVINSLADRNNHIPFRESKLTRLLQDSLGGNTKTALIATISPAKVTSEETCSTLEYASKAKNIKNKPQLGSIISKDILLKNITTELSQVKSDLLSTKSKEGIYMSQEHYQKLMNELDNHKTEADESKRIIERLSSQNALLLKDKRTSNEVNELQRIKLSKFQDSINMLQEKIEIQNGKEQMLVSSVSKLQTSCDTFKKMIENYECQQIDVKSKIEQILEDDLLSLRNLLQDHQNKIKTLNSGTDFDIGSNLDMIQNEVIKMLGTTQEKAEKTYKQFIEGFLKQTPENFKKIGEDINDINIKIQNHHAAVAQNLSDISEEYNNLKQYLNENLFQNNHEDLINAHINSTSQTLTNSADVLFNTFKDMMNKHLESNRNLMLNSFKAATDEVINKEMELFIPRKKKWEESIDLINQCDSLNNGFQKEVTDGLSYTRSKITASINQMYDNSTRLKTEMSADNGGYNSINTKNVVEDNQIIRTQFNELARKNSIFQDNVENSLKCAVASVNNLNHLEDSIKMAVRDTRIKGGPTEGEVGVPFKKENGKEGPTKPGLQPLQPTNEIFLNSQQDQQHTTNGHGNYINKDNDNINHKSNNSGNVTIIKHSKKRQLEKIDEKNVSNKKITSNKG